MIDKIDEGELEKALNRYREAKDIVLIKLKDAFLQDKRLNSYGLIMRMYSRLKGVDSIFENITRKKLVVNTIEDIFEKIDDIAGIRIIPELLNEVDIIEEIITKLFKIISRSDFIHEPMENGCRVRNLLISVDTENYKEVKCEIQIRTLAQEFWALQCFSFIHKQDQGLSPLINSLIMDLSNKLYEAEKIAIRLKRDI